MYSTPVDLSFSYLRSAVEASLDIKKDQVDPNTPLSREADPAASVPGLTPFVVLLFQVHVDRCGAAPCSLHVPVDGDGVDLIVVPPAEELVGSVHEPVQLLSCSLGADGPSTSSMVSLCTSVSSISSRAASAVIW
jgi:hypothetical protein